MIELHSLGPWMKCNANIVLLCFFKLPSSVSLPIQKSVTTVELFLA